MHHPNPSDDAPGAHAPEAPEAPEAPTVTPATPGRIRLPSGLTASLATNHSAPGSWLTLAFTGELAQLEEEFGKTYFSWSLPHVRRLPLLAVLLYAGATLFDAILAPGQWVAVACIRQLAVSVIFLGAWGLSYAPVYARIWQSTIGGLIVITAMGFIFSIPFVPPLAADLYFVAVIVCLIFGHTFARARFVTGAIAGSVAVLAYAIVVLVPQGGAASPLQQASLGYLLLVHLLGMMVSRAQERANRRHFLLAYRLEQEAAKVADSNRTLETLVAERTAELACANAELRAEMDRRLHSQQQQQRLAEQLQQAQKMEAIGLLAGGVAHDFNNILTAIVGNAQEALAAAGSDAPQADAIQEILIASDRATGLTRQLLAFARKQATHPEVIQLSQVVDDTTKMLRRILGGDVELLTRSAAGLWQAYVDPGHVQQMLVNLAVNARDAMVEGGRLTIETENATLNSEAEGRPKGARPGDYVVIRVTDTGCGIDPEMQQRIFEPFFTTKELGKGTGLGLSIVFGTVQQAGGHVDVDSRLGVGTSFSVYLPRSEHSGQFVAVEPKPPAQRSAGQTILVIEDDEPVRRVLQRLLKSAGYSVLPAPTCARALQYVGELDCPPNLVLSDVSLPGENGVDCVEQLQQHWPEVNAILMSGHIEGSILSRVEQGGYAVLPKPFQPQTVLQAIQQALSGTPAPVD